MTEPRRAVLYMLVLFLSLVSGAKAPAAGEPVYGGGPLVVSLYPEDSPVSIGFHLAGGGAAERFTGNRDSRYSVCRLWMQQGISYELVLRHDGDPDRLRLYALDGHPFGEVHMRYELKLVEKGRVQFRTGHSRIYTAYMKLPDKIHAAEIYLLLELLPRTDKNKPMSASLQVLRMYPYFRAENSPLYFRDSRVSIDTFYHAGQAVILPLRR